MSEASATRGESLVNETGVYHHAKMGDSMDVLAWIHENREYANTHGHCKGGCNRELIQHETKGHSVCPLTYEECKGGR
jgi:hypothetical protein